MLLVSRQSPGHLPHFVTDKLATNEMLYVISCPGYAGVLACQCESCHLLFIQVRIQI